MGGGIVEVERTQETPPLRFAPGFNVAVPFIDRHVAEGRGRKAAIRTLHGDVTYAALATGVDRCAGVLVGLGLQPGERMLMVVKDCPAFFYLFWGAIKAGIIPVPVNTLLRQATYAFMIDDSGAAAIVYSPEFAAEVEPGIASAARRPRRVLRTDGDEPSLATLLARSGPRFDAVPADAEDDCFWLYSSGSTGQPKAAVHRHRDMAVTSQRFGVETLGITSDDVCYSEAKLFFAYGLGNNMLPRIVGAGRAADLLYSGRAMDGVEAERWGFFNRLCEPESVLADAQAMARSIADGPTFAHAMTKRCIHQEWSMGIDESIEAEAQAQAICMQTKDYERAYEAFVARTKPVFEGN